MNHQLVFISLKWLCSGYALLRGGGPERSAAALILISAYASELLLSPAIMPSSRFSHFEAGVFLVDLVDYVASLLIMLRAERFWTIWMSALFGVELLAHLLAVPGVASLNLTYAILERVWGYPIILLPAIGALRHRRRLKRFGVDRSWSASSGPSRRRPQAWTSPSD